MLEARARQIGVRVDLRDPGSPAEPGSIACLHVPLSFACSAGSLDPRSACYVMTLIDRAAGKEQTTRTWQTLEKVCAP